MEDLIPLAFFVLLAFLGAIALARYLADERRRRRVTTRQIQRDATGSVTAIGGRERPEERFRGAGPESTRPIRLTRGTYWLQYRFAAGVLTSVTLVRLADGHDLVLMIKSGDGQMSIDIDETGDYLFRVEPADGRAAWAFSLTRVGWE
ncbi:MAG: hypothetical protein DIU68_017885 [Chloroflexota bacterium]|nr:MAG: hypothetical protein DIU68_07130 [Chloroflexota bacterium]